MERGDERWRSLIDESSRRYGRLYFRIAYGVVRNAVTAEDMCQQAYLKAWEHRNTIVADEIALRYWLCRVVLTESLQYRRRSKIEFRVLQGQGQAVEECTPGPDVVEIEAMCAALQQLSETERLVVSLRFILELPGNETGEILGISAGQVSRILHRGLKQLRGLLE